MKAHIVDVVIIAALLGGAWWLAHAHVQAEYRREVVQARTLERQQRFIDGLAEQVDEQADGIARLETALTDLNSTLFEDTIQIGSGRISSRTVTVSELEQARKKTR